MNRQLLDRDPDELARHLLEHGRRDHPTEGARRRTVEKAVLAATIGIGLSTASVTSGAAAAGSWLIVVKWIAAGAATAAIALGVTHELRPTLFSTSPPAARSALPGAPISAPPTAGAPLAPAEERRALESSPSPVPPNAGPDVGLGPPQETPPMSRQSPRHGLRRDRLAPPDLDPRPTPLFASPPVAAPPAADSAKRTDTLEQELRSLEQARTWLDDRSPDRALAELDGYAQRFPAGSLGIEAAALRVETLLALGQRSAGQALGRSFLARYPQSPAAMRVRRLLDESMAGTQKP